MTKLTKINLKLKLLDFKDGKISPEGLQIWAEKVINEHKPNLYEDWNNIECYSSINEILFYLESLDMNLATPRDMNACIKFLDNNINAKDQAYLEWSSYLKQIDYEKRKQELGFVDFYIPFCQ